jgi:hypothetical protein
MGVRINLSVFDMEMLGEWLDLYLCFDFMVSLSDTAILKCSGSNLNIMIIQ